MEKKEAIKEVEIIAFDEEIAPFILEAYDCGIDEKGKVIDKKTNQVITDIYSDEEIKIKNFAGIVSGSKIFLSKNNASLVEHINKFCKKEG